MIAHNFNSITQQINKSPRYPVIVLTAFLLFFAITHTSAQSTPHLTLSLQAALDTGLANRYDIQADAYKITLAENAIDKRRNDRLPDININGDIRYNSQLQATYIPAGFGGLTQPELLALGARNTTVFGLTLDQPIIKPGITTSIKMAQNDLALQKEKNRQTAIDIKMRIATAYLDVLLKELQYTIARHDEERYNDYTTLAKAKYDHGALLENDYLQTRLDHENAKVLTEIARQQYTLAYDQLKYQMNVPADATLTLTDTLGATPLPPANMQTRIDPTGRTEVQQLLLQQQFNKLSLQKVRQELLPTLSLVGNYSQQFMYDNFNYGRGQWWSPFSYAGLKLQVPISAHLRSRTDRREFQLRMTQTALLLSQKTADIDYEVSKTQTELNNAYSNMQVTRSNYELSGVIYQDQKRQYLLGAFQYGSLLDTERSLSTAEQNYIKAVYNYLLSRINYQQAIGGF